jgi:hypothetical protein
MTRDTFTIVMYPTGDYMLTCSGENGDAIHDGQNAVGEAQSAWNCDVDTACQYVRQISGTTLAIADETIAELRSIIESKKTP